MNRASVLNAIDNITNSIQIWENVLVSGSYTPVSDSYSTEGAVSQALENAAVSFLVLNLSSSLTVKDLVVNLGKLPGEAEESSHVVLFTGYDSAPLEVQDAVSEFIESHTLNNQTTSETFLNVSSFIVVTEVHVDDLPEDFLNLFPTVVEFG